MTVRSHHLSWSERTTLPDGRVLLVRGLTEGYSTSRVYLASMYVQESVYDRFATEDHDHLMRFIWDSADDSFFGAIRGKLFEEHAHRRLVSGESFRVRRLDGPAGGSGDGAEQVTFGALDTLIVQGVDDIRAGSYCRVRAQNFESIDAPWSRPPPSSRSRLARSTPSSTTGWPSSSPSWPGLGRSGCTLWCRLTAGPRSGSRAT
jgi:hypothetical protein